MANEEKIIKITIDDKEALVRIDNISKQLDTLGKNDTATKKALILEQKLLIKNLVEEEKLQQQRIKTLIESEKLDQKKIQTTNAANKQVKVTEGYLNELRASVQSLEKAYFQLTEAEYKNAKTNVVGTKGAQVLTSLKEQRAALAEAEAAYGKHNLNVGNYSSATKMLGINLGQVMKEMPNFAISARIGIMSLTNNLPMLAETIKAVRVEQLAMIEAGKQAPSMFSLMAKSIFGLTGVMSIAMVLLQIYGADIIKWVGNLIKGEQAVKNLTNAELGLNTIQQTLNKTMKDSGGVYGTAVSSIEKHTIALKAAKGNTELTKEALDEYNNSLGVTFGKATDVDSALKLIADNQSDYIEAMKNMAFANAFFSQSSEDMVKIVKIATASNSEILGEKSNDYIKEIETAKERLQNGASEWVNTWNAAGQKTIQLVAVNRNVLEQDLNKAINNYNVATQKERNRQISEIQKNQNISLKEAEKYYNKWAALYKKNGWDFDDKEKGKTKTAKKTFDYEGELRKLQTQAIENQYIKDLQIAMNNYDKDEKKYKEALAQKLIDNEQYQNLNKALNERFGKELYDIDSKWQNKIAQNARDSIKLLQQTINEELSNDDLAVKAMIDNLMRNLNAAVADADISLATNQLLGIPDLEQQYTLLEEQRHLAVTEAKLRGEDVTMVEAYYAAKRAKIENDLNNSKLASVADVIGSISSMLEEGSIAQKVAATAQATINTYLGATGAFAQTPGDIVTKSLAAAAAVASGLASVYQIWKVDTSVPETKTTKSTTQVTEKFHTGTYRPSSSSEEKEITRTLLTSERILSPTQTAIFDSMIGKVKSLGGSSNITNGVGVSDYLQESMLVRAFSVALQNQKPQQISWTEFSNQAQRQQQLQNNLIVR